jgi:Tol biopolymer transport system component
MKLLITLALIAVATKASGQTDDTERDYALTFLSHRSGFNQIYTCHPDGSKPQPFFGGPITDGPSFNESYTMFREPHWTRQSPDGKYFASWVYEIGKPYSEYSGVHRPMLIVGDIEKTWTRIASPDAHEEFAWSPNSKMLAYSILASANYHGSLQKRPDATEIFISGTDGSNATCVLEQTGKWMVLDWSPDGKRLLISRRSFTPKPTGELFEFRLHAALEDRQHAEYAPDWSVKSAPRFLELIDLGLDHLQLNSARYSPTRNEIALEAYNPENMHAPNLVADEDDELGRGRMMRLLSKIYVFDLTVRKSLKVADYEDGIRGPICWSPDGNEILFSRYLPNDDDREKLAESKEHGLSIWSVDRDGNNEKFVTTGWSPDYPQRGSKTGK